jgi:C4-dicarboxylate-specific signal transduction histidine kinase
MDALLITPLTDLARLACYIARCSAASIEVEWAEADANDRPQIKKFEVIYPTPNESSDQSNGQGPAEMISVMNCSLKLYHPSGVKLDESQREGLLTVAIQAVSQVRLMQVGKSQERAIAQSAKMSALGEMAAGIAHEINNPLAIIQGNLNKMRTLIENEILDPGVLSDSISVATKTVARIGKIVHGLRNFARDGEGEPFQAAEIFRIVDETLSLCLERFKNHNVKVQVSSIPHDLVLECRHVQVSQVLLNLLSNAFDAVENLPERWVSLNCIDGKDHVDIIVTDSGSGIAKEVQDKIFQPFFTTKSLGKGTGLGLSIARGIVDSHGGSLQLESVGPNTCFKITFPKKQAKAVARVQESKVPAGSDVC